MHVRIALFLIIFNCAYAIAQAPVVCPWLSTGSAETALGGSVTVTAQSENNWHGECHFARQTAGSSQAIDVRVSKVEFHPCPDGSTRLTALGNEAWQCPSGDHADTIAGRVRDAWFMVTMTGVPEAAREPQSKALPADSYGASMLERLAEQVAGNLY